MSVVDGKKSKRGGESARASAEPARADAAEPQEDRAATVAPEPEQARAKLSSKNQIVIPKLIRRKLGLAAGDTVLLRAEEGILYVMPEPKDWATAMQGLGADIWETVDVKEYVRELREDRDIEP